MTSADNGHFVWYDHLTRDPQAAIAFYTEVVGWRTQPFGEGNDYTLWLGSQGPLGGVMKLPDDAASKGAPSHWMGNVKVKNVDETVETVKKLGGKIHKAPTDIPTVGRFAVIEDPQGASISVFEPKGEMLLHDSTKEGEICWNELVTRDSAAAFEFYSTIFGWKILQEMDMGPMGKYRIYGVGDKQLGGMMTAPPGKSMPPSWMFYAEVADLDAALGRATKRGAKVLSGPMDVPGGRMVQLADPQGAPIALHQLVKK
ncbi:MAG: VOC family protein [Deltaproteobacteria bacterium]|nr:VOC family protein [Deltaproteobacteria bacterium]